VKRLFSLLLLATLLFQAAYAIAAPYCAHETNGPWHFGHHAHKHVQSGGDASDKQPDGESFGQHADCASCHLGSATFVVASFDQPQDRISDRVAQNEPASAHSLSPPRPERPKWSAAV